MKQKYDVTGMTCSACSSRVEKSVEKLEGVNRVSVNLLNNSMQVDYVEKIMTGRDIISCVEKAGYGASVAGGAPAAAKPPAPLGKYMVFPFRSQVEIALLFRRKHGDFTRNRSRLRPARRAHDYWHAGNERVRTRHQLRNKIVYLTE